MKDLLHLDTSGTTNVFGTQPKIVKNNGNTFDCTVNFDRALKIRALELESAEIPNNFYNVQSPYNVVPYNNGYQTTIPPGIYTVPEVLSTLNKNSPYFFQLSNGYVQDNTTASPTPFINLPFNGSNVDSVNGLSPSTSIGPPTYVNGVNGQAVFFNQTGGTTPTKFLSYDLPPGITANSCTVSMWVKPSFTIPSSFGNQISVCLGDSQVTDNYQFGMNSGISQLRPFIYYGANGTKIISGSNVSTGVWYHMVGVFSNVGQSGQNTLLTYYHNGISQGSASLSRGPTSFMNILNVGAVKTSTGSAFISVQDLRIYNTALSAAQVSEIYNQRDVLFSPPKIPVINLPFNGSNVDTINNISPKTTFFYPEKPIYTSGKSGQGIYLNNSLISGSQYHEQFLIYDLSSSIVADKGITICYWANYQSFLYDGTMALYDNIPDGNTFSISINMSNSTFGSVNRAGRGSYRPYLDPITVNGIFSTGTWYHIAATFSKNACISYLNGAVGSSNVFVSPVTTGISFTGMRLGRITNNFPGGGSGFGQADVILSDLRVYNTALTPAQINSIYNQSGVNFPSVTSITNSSGSLMNMLGFAPGTIGYGAIAWNLPYLNANEYISLFIENVGVSSNENRQISYKIPTGSIVHQNVSFPPPYSPGAGELSVTQVLYGSPFASGAYTFSGSSVSFNGNAPQRAFTPLGGFYKPFYPQYSGSDGSYLGSNVTTDYVTGAVYPGEWVQIQLPFQTVLKTYRIDFDAYGAANYVQVLGSTDGSNWIFIQSPSGGVNKTFETPLSVPFMYFRFIIPRCTAISSSSPGIGQITLTGSVISSPSTIYWAKHNQNTQIIKCPDASLSKLNIKVLDRFGNQITSGSDWSFTLVSKT